MNVNQDFTKALCEVYHLPTVIKKLNRQDRKLIERICNGKEVKDSGAIKNTTIKIREINYKTDPLRLLTEKILLQEKPNKLKLIYKKLVNTFNFYKYKKLTNLCTKYIKNHPKERWLVGIDRGKKIQFSSVEIKKDHKVMLAAVQRDGLELEFVSDELKRNKQIVLAAVKQNGLALKFADKELRKDREVVRAAVRQNGKALKFASKLLKNDPKTVRIAIKQDLGALVFASEELKKDPSIKALFTKKIS